METLEHDIVCLVDSLKYLKDDIHQQIQALEHLSNMCLEDKGGYFFQKVGGLSVVLKMIFDKNQNPLVLQKSFLTLGNASLANDENKNILNTDHLMTHIKTMLMKDSTHKLIAASSYLLACICSGNEKAQNRARKCRCLESLVMLYRHFHPNGEIPECSLDEEWFEKAGSQAPIVLTHISHALKSIISKPTNKENQLLCSKLLILAINTFMCGHITLKAEALCFISDCVYENAKALQIFNMVGGIRCLAKVLKQQLNDVTEVDLLPCILDTLTIVFTDCNSNKDCASEMGIVNDLVDCLRLKIIHNVQLKCLICIAECVHENEKCQKAFLQSNGIPVVIGLMSTKQDETISKVGMTILQSCVANITDYGDTNVSDMNPSFGVSKLLNFFGNEILQKPEYKKSKSSHNKTINFEEKENINKKQNCSKLEQKENIIKMMKFNVDKDASNKGCEQEMIGLLLEQKKIMQSFQKDFNKFKEEVKASDLSSTNIDFEKINRSLPDDGLMSTPKRRPLLFSSSTKRNIYSLENVVTSQVYDTNQILGRTQTNSNTSVENFNNGSLVCDERPALAKKQGISHNIYPPTEKEDKIDFKSIPPFNLTMGTIEKVEKWRQECPTSNFHQNFDDYNDIQSKSFKVPTGSMILKKKNLPKFTENFQENCSHGSVTPSMCLLRKPTEEIQCAPRKPPITKRRRLIDFDFKQFSTPEHNTNCLDTTKRALNFARFSNLEKLNFSINGDLKLQSQADDSECVSAAVKNVSMPNEMEVKEKNSSQCIACNPFNRFNIVSVNSRNLYSILKQSHTCLFHEEFLRKCFNWKYGTLHSSMFNISNVSLSNNSVTKSISKVQKKSFIFDDDVKSFASLASTGTSVASRRRSRQDYSKEEVNYILEGVERYGTRWTAILNSYPFKNGRQATDLRGKYKQIKKLNIL
ncbi:uncharacterized protein LOC101241833 isoform X1 [Hydra vulgaris]|uniref:uncharacterized protein LOC101241833 isoform X1 n=1 Tax=Hydra vulgaris TaxID=6087 RepID=UPI001F5FB966|nr:uncharacterized protein LOC101241833 [Hydra vulgaris]